MIVFEVQGWFGDVEWSEGIWAKREDAQAHFMKVAKDRRTTVEGVPEFVQGLCKFAVVERPVQ